MQWEWELDKTIKKIELDNFVFPPHGRDGLFGGRPECFFNYYRLTDNEIATLYDVVSLYPTVMFHSENPLGHHRKIFNTKVYDKNWFGLIQCKLLHPKNLWLPVLPYKAKVGLSKKLILGLCKKCMETQATAPCYHTEEESSFITFSTTMEIKLALEQGYKILKIFEVWHWEQTTKEVFANYMKTFLKI